MDYSAGSSLFMLVTSVCNPNSLTTSVLEAEVLELTSKFRILFISYVE